MSTVRYVNKETGRVSIYEQYSEEDPETHRKRRVRKYLGTEDPITKQLIPSSGKRGRKKGSGATKNLYARDEVYTELRSQIEEDQKTIAEKDDLIRQKTKENAALQKQIDQINTMVKTIEGALARYQGHS